MPSWGTSVIDPKVGDKVTVHYEINSRGWWFTYKVEKAGKSEKGSKNR
jgi:hypothetical protein